MTGEVYHGRISSPDGETGEGYEALLHMACVEWGFCGRLIDGRMAHVNDFMPDSGEVTAGEWVNAVLRADRIDPSAIEDEYARQAEALEAAFIRFLGADRVPAAQLKE